MNTEKETNVTHPDHYTLKADWIFEKLRQGLEGLPELLRILMNADMQTEREKYLQASEYERTEKRKGYANGYKPKTVKTRVGGI